MNTAMRLCFLLLTCILTSCTGGGSKLKSPGGTSESLTHETVAPVNNAVKKAKTSPTARKLDSMGLVNIAALDPSITVRIIYATPDNFTGEVLYGDLTEACLLPEAAEKLVKAQKALKEKYPDYSLIVYDAARPMSVQRKMRETAVKTGKQYYVADPAKGGGLHNYGAAVDVSIVDGKGKPLPMGTEYDFLGPESNTDREKELVETGKITPAELKNRLLLREVMTGAGFRTVTSEWWHFNHCSLAEAIKKYKPIDF